MSEVHAVHLSFPAKADYLLLVRLALTGIMRGRPIDEDTVADLKLAVTEACGNAVRHAYPGDGGSVEVAFLLDDDRLDMVVEDQGTGIGLHDARDEEDGAVEAEEPAEAPEGAMGLAIIRAIVDELQVLPGADGRGTVVRMTKYLSASHTAA